MGIAGKHIPPLYKLSPGRPIRLISDILGVKEKAQSQVCQRSIPLSHYAKSFRPISLSPPPHVSSTSLRHRKPPYSFQYAEEDLRNFGTQRHKYSAPASTSPEAQVRANLNPRNAAPIDYSPFAQTHRRSLRRHKDHESNLDPPVTSERAPNSQKSDIQFSGPIKRPRPPSRDGQRPVKCREELIRHALKGGLAEIINGNSEAGVSKEIQSERPSAKRRCTVLNGNFPTRGKGVAVRSISPYRNTIQRRTVLSNIQDSEPKHSRDRRYKIAPARGLEGDNNSMSNRGGDDFRFEECGGRDLDKIAEAASKLVGKAPMSEVLRVLGDIEEMAERYIELLRSPLVELPGGRSREDVVSEIERCRDDAFNQLLGRCRDENRAEQHAALLGHHEPIHETSSYISWDLIAEAVQKSKDPILLERKSRFPVGAGIRYHGNGGSVARGEAVMDEYTDIDPVPGAFPVDMAFQEENREDESDSGSDREKRVSNGTPQSSHYIEDSDEATSEETNERCLGKGKDEMASEDEEASIAMDSQGPTADGQNVIGYDGEVEGDSQGYGSGYDSQELSQNEAEATPERTSRHSTPRITLGVGTSSAGVDEIHSLHHHSSRGQAKWRSETGRQKSRSPRPGGILKRGHRKAGVSPKRVKNVGRRSTQAETEVATISYIPDSAPAASRLSGIRQESVDVEIDIPSSSRGTRRLPLSTGPSKEVRTVNRLSGELSSRPPRLLDDLRAETRVNRAAFKIRLQREEAREGMSHSTVKARVRGVRLAKAVGLSVNPGEDENPGLFDSSLDGMDSDDAATRILPRLINPRPQGRRHSNPEATGGSSDWESDHGSDTEGAPLQRVRSLITPFESDDRNEESSQSGHESSEGSDSGRGGASAGQHGDNPGGLTTGLGRLITVDKHTPRSMATQRRNGPLGGSPSTWTGRGHIRRSKSASPVATARSGLSAMFRVPSRIQSNASDGSSKGSLGRKMKKLLSNPPAPWASMELGHQSPVERISRVSSRRTSFVESAASDSTQTSNPTPAIGSALQPSLQPAPAAPAAPAAPTAPTVLFRTSGPCAPQRTRKHVERAPAPPPEEDSHSN